MLELLHEIDFRLVELDQLLLIVRVATLQENLLYRDYLFCLLVPAQINDGKCSLVKYVMIPCRSRG